MDLGTLFSPAQVHNPSRLTATLFVLSSVVLHLLASSSNLTFLDMAATFDYHEMMPKGPATDRIKTSKYWNPVRDETLSMNVPNVSDLLPFAVQGNMMCAKVCVI